MRIDRQWTIVACSGIAPALRGGAMSIALCSLLAACASDDSGEPSPGDSEEPGPGSATPGIAVTEAQVVFSTAEFTLEPGQERYLCYAATTAEALVIDGYSHAGKPFLHHVVFSRARAPEPEGLSECDILFRNTWDPLFIAGAGASSIDFPDDVGHQLPAETQLVVQLHLLNTREEPVTDSVAITMQRSTAANPRPMGTYVFGTTSVNLPPLQESQLEAVCQLEQRVQLVAAFPHMHLLGTSLTFEVGSSMDTMETVFTRDPYDFDDQHLELLDLTLEPGDVTRVRCSYDNPHDQNITFGESTTNEMCFFIGLAADQEGLKGCMLGGTEGDGDEEEVPVDPAAGACGDHEPTDTGVGTACTAGGSECAAGQMCTADFRGTPEGLCISIGCESDADCGSGGNATCCTPSQGGGAINICMPEACRSPSCIPVE
jgi:hypothetical protein